MLYSRSTQRALPLLAFVATAVLLLAGCAGGSFGELITGRNLGCCGLIIVIADVFAFIKIAQSGANGASKALWALLVFFFPVGGFALWYFFGPRS